jgi:tRNA A-37 threonylcarbamoyl transferase component Bud32
MPSESVVRLSATSEYRPDPGRARTPAPGPQCRIRREAGSGFHSELAALLHGRLRVVTMILASGYLAVGIRNLALFASWITPADHLIVFSMTALMALCAALLWRQSLLSLCWLRRIELLVFAAVVLHFAWLNTRVFDDLQSTLLVGTRNELLGWRLGNVDNTLRWFILVVLYGVFIPNTGRRCGFVVIAMAALHLAITLIMGVFLDRLPLFLTNLAPDLVIFMGVAVAIAIFGSAKIAALQQEAFASRRLGQYQLKRQLGVGGMGEVYLAEHLLLRRPCVVKLIRPDRKDESTAQVRFEREVMTTATLRHWNTVAIFDYGHTDDGAFYYVMEYLPGLTLQEIVARSGPLPPARVVHILRQLCGALHEAHGIGLIHRDIKPSNIMLCQLGGLHDVAKLLDFGLVQTHTLADPSDGRLTREGYIVGTPDFMAPEQAQDSELIDARADIYSLGAMAYFLLSGAPPFVRKTPMQVVVAHSHEPVPPLRTKRPEVPPELEAVILRCLEKRPERRFPSARALEQALAPLAERMPWTEEDAEAWWQGRDWAAAPSPADAPTLVTTAEK